jgi:sensor histidine kinase YesM
MTVQTFVENAIKHGFENRKEGGTIAITLTHTDNFLRIVMRDNGIGRAESNKIKSTGTGYGIKTVNKVIDIMNKNNKNKASLDIRDITNGVESSGTEVAILIPDNYNFRTESFFGNQDDSQDEIKY